MLRKGFHHTRKRELNATASRISWKMSLVERSAMLGIDHSMQAVEMWSLEQIRAFLGSCPKSVIAPEGLSLQWVPALGGSQSTAVCHSVGGESRRPKKAPVAAHD